MNCDVRNGKREKWKKRRRAKTRHNAVKMKMFFQQTHIFVSAPPNLEAALLGTLGERRKITGVWFEWFQSVNYVTIMLIFKPFQLHKHRNFLPKFQQNQNRIQPVATEEFFRYASYYLKLQRNKILVKFPHFRRTREINLHASLAIFFFALAFASLYLESNEICVSFVRYEMMNFEWNYRASLDLVGYIRLHFAEKKCWKTRTKVGVSIGNYN